MVVSLWNFIQLLCARFTSNEIGILLPTSQTSLKRIIGSVLYGHLGESLTLRRYTTDIKFFSLLYDRVLPGSARNAIIYFSNSPKFLLLTKNHQMLGGF